MSREQDIRARGPAAKRGLRRARWRSWRSWSHAHWGGPPLHRHDFDEAFYVLDGELTFQLDDELWSATRGGFAFARGGRAHTLANLGDEPARYLLADHTGWVRALLRSSGRRECRGRAAGDSARAGPGGHSRRAADRGTRRARRGATAPAQRGPGQRGPARRRERRPGRGDGQHRPGRSRGSAASPSRLRRGLLRARGRAHLQARRRAGLASSGRARLRSPGASTTPSQTRAKPRRAMLLVCTPAGFERYFQRMAARQAGVEPPPEALEPWPEVVKVGPRIGEED